VAKLNDRLAQFTEEGSIRQMGALAVMLVITRHAKERGLPLSANDLITKEQGQVLGLGMGAVQAILADHGITRVLAKEGGRTSRGSLGNMQRYVAFLNQLHKDGIADLESIEAWWIERVRDFFADKGFTLTFDPSKSLRYVVDDLLAQAVKRQKESAGTMFAGAILQHLVGAKLALILDDASVSRHGFSVADESSSRTGDFIIEDVSIHVTTAPSEALMSKCLDNLNAGLRPLVITTSQSLAGAQSLAEIKGIGQRVDIIEASQFLATNFYEWSKFKSADRKISVERLVAKYNEIVTQCETDPGLRIGLGK
jgi:hypothetical protein